MKLADVIAELEATVLCGADEQLGAEVSTTAAGDLMSDILARTGRPDLLLTGLTTTQAIRTSAVAGVKALIIVRGKLIDEKMIALAGEENIVLMSTRLSMFEAAGRLYVRGLRSMAVPS